MHYRGKRKPIQTNNPITSPPLLERQIIQRNNLLGYNHDLLREFFHKAFRVDWRYSSCLMVTERQGYYRLVRGVKLRNLQPQDFKWLPNYLSTAQSNVALEKSKKNQKRSKDGSCVAITL